MARANAFAQACLETTEMGRLALGVMDGRVFAGARLVGLAERVLRDAGEAAVVELRKK